MSKKSNEEGRLIVKVFSSVLITLLVLILLSLGISYFTNSGFFDYAFFVGAMCTITIWFFTSKGGLTTRNMDSSIQGSTGIKGKEHYKFEFSVGPSFITSLVFTIFTFISMLYQYKDYIG